MSEGGREYWAGSLTLSQAAQKRFQVRDITEPYENHVCDITLFVYAHNMEATLLDTFSQLLEAMDVVEHSFELVIIDDASTDQTTELLHGFVLENSHIPIVLRKNRDHKGLANNYADAAFIGRGKYFRLILADNSEPVETMVDVMRSIGEADIIVPHYVDSRFYRQGAQANSGMLGWLVALVRGDSVSTSGAAHIHLRYNVMRWHGNMQGPGFQNDLLARLLELGFTSKQTPCRAMNVSYHAQASRQGFWSNIRGLTYILAQRLRNL